MLSGRGLCDELITRPEESYRLCCIVVHDLETSRMGAPYIYDISHLRVKQGRICALYCMAFSFLNAVMMVKLMQYDLVWVGRYDCTVNEQKNI